jgi:hypothetical protein
MEEYNFRQARNGWIVQKGSMPGLYNDTIYVFNSSKDMGKWVEENLRPADEAQPGEQGEM